MFSLSSGNSSSGSSDYTTSCRSATFVRSQTTFQWLRTVVVLFAISLAGCSTLQPPDPNGPRGIESNYPVLYVADDVRKNAVSSTLVSFSIPASTTTGPELTPITLTVKNLGPPQSKPLYLPKLGTGAVMTEEETRESLRRFIRQWQDLIGSDPAKLSLIERTDQPDGTKLASYEQRPFRYPIRGPFGKLEIRFANDRRVVSMSSSCVPNAERIQTALAGNVAKLKAEDVVNQLVSNPISVPGGTPSLTVQAGQVTPRELVVYIRPSTTNTDALEFHVAWEVEVKNAPVKVVYVDAINGEIIASE